MRSPQYAPLSPLPSLLLIFNLSCWLGPAFLQSSPASPADSNLIPVHRSTHGDIATCDLSPKTGVAPTCLCHLPSRSPLCCQSLTGAAPIAESMCRGSYPPTAFSPQCPCWKQIPQLTYASPIIFKSLRKGFLYQKRLILPPKLSNH